MNKKKLGLIGAVALTLLGTISLVAFVNSAEDRALKGQEVVSVFVVKQAVPAGTATEALAPAVELRRIPLDAMTEGAVNDLSTVTGKVTTADLVTGDQLTTARLGSPEDYKAIAGVTIPEGKMEVTISVGSAQSVGGTLNAGDLVALAYSANGTTGVVLHKVLVIGVQGDPLPAPAAADPAAGGAAPDPTARTPISGGIQITLAVDAREFQKVVFAAENGSIYLAREPDVAPEPKLAPQSETDIYG